MAAFVFDFDFIDLRLLSTFFAETAPDTLACSPEFLEAASKGTGTPTTGAVARLLELALSFDSVRVSEDSETDSFFELVASDSEVGASFEVNDATSPMSVGIVGIKTARIAFWYAESLRRARHITGYIASSPHTSGALVAIMSAATRADAALFSSRDVDLYE